MLASTTNSLVRTLLGPTCAACAAELIRPLAGPVCEACRAAVRRLTAPLCVICGDVLSTAGPLCVRCAHHRPHFTIARSVGRYDGALRELIHAFKYGRRRALAEPLAGWMKDAGREVLTSADALVPVPLHPLRLVERGFNQADDLARLLGVPVWPVLRRARHGRPQAALPAEARRLNVRAAFGLERRWKAALTRPMRARPLQGAAIVLIDDVMTTGATLDACSRVLVAAGVRRVAALTVARSASAPHPRSPLPPGPASARHR